MCFEAPKRAGNYFVLCSGGSELRSRYSRKPQNPFQRKRLRELVPRLLQQAPKRVNSILNDLQKSCAASCAPHGRARLVGRVMQLARRGECAPTSELQTKRRAEDCLPYRTRMHSFFVGRARDAACSPWRVRAVLCDCIAAGRRGLRALPVR